MSKEKLKIGKQNHTSQTGKHVGAGPVSARNKTQTGITLVALVITIIVMLILVGVTLITALNGGLFPQAKKATDEYENAKNIEQIKAAYMMAKGESEIENKTNREMFEKIKNNLNLEGATYKINSQSMTITTKKGKTYTLLANGELIEGKFAYLDIADGSIELKSNGYIQGQDELVEYTGKYIITGITTENTVKVMDEGTYDITIKDLSIDVSSVGSICAFNANRGSKSTGCYVTITIEGENKLCGGGAPGLGFANATPNVDGVTNGSTLTIQGDGKLEVVGGNFSAGIGTGYSGWEVAAGDANNITINSGTIIVKTGSNGCPIGGGLRKNVNNLVINGGNITALASNRSGIGTCSNETGKGILQNLKINGGNITVTGGEYGGPIGGASGSGEILITGGIINAKYTHRNSSLYPTIGDDCSSIKIEGGTIICHSAKGIGIGSDESIEINGGNVVITAGVSNFSVDPTVEGNKVYLTKVQLSDIKKETQITSLTTSDNINYGIKDMYTTQDDESTADINEGGMLYLYLPLGSRTITVEAGGTTYSGTAETTETSTLVTLNKQ